MANRGCCLGRRLRSVLWSASLWGWLICCLAAPAPGTEPGPFERATSRVQGRPLDVFSRQVGSERHLVVLSVEGTAPREQRRVSVFTPRPGDRRYAATPSFHLDVPASCVAVDAADVAPEPGLEIVLLSARELRIQGAAGSPPRSIALEPTLPLPARTRGVERMAFLRDWTGDGRPSVLAPALDGLKHVELDGSGQRFLHAPLWTAYEARHESVPIRDGVLRAVTRWPELALGDDDGDGRTDLFALSRYQIAVFRNGPDGLPSRPSRTIELFPFNADEELRWQATSLSPYARDIDGDGLTDLVVHKTIGTLMNSRTNTTFYRNTGDGADPTGTGDVVLETTGGFGTVQIEDFDGDGRFEVLQTHIAFGVLQLVRALVTETMNVNFTVSRFAEPGIGAAVPSWRSRLSMKLDFDEGRIVGVLPTLQGDWNADGRRDLLYGDGASSIAIRLGETDGGPGFDGPMASQDVPGAERGYVADLDGDGLDDLALYDPMDAEGAVHILYNRGTLPGSPPSLRPD